MKLLKSTKKSFWGVALLLILGLILYFKPYQKQEKSQLAANENTGEKIKQETQPLPTTSPTVFKAPSTSAINKEPSSLKTIHKNQNPSSGDVASDKLLSAVSVKDEEASKREEIEARWKAEFDMVKDPKTGKIPAGIRKKEINAAQKVHELVLPAELSEDGVSLRTLPTIDVTVRGPINYGGRTRAIAFDKRNTQIVMAGGVSGGIFRSTDGGTTWSRVTPSGQIHSVTAIAQDPRAGQEDTWYFGTGESGNSASGTGASYLGHGIWKSTDNGVTWTALASTQGNLYSYDVDFDNISRILVNPNNGHVLVTAGETVQRSTDGGATWGLVVGDVSATGRPCDLIYNAVGSVFYAAIQGEAANGQGGIYRSADGETWTKIRTPTELHASGVKRIVLANVAATANILAFYETVNNVACGASKAGLQLYDPTGMGSWTDHTAKIGVCATGGSNPKQIDFQGGYNMCITTKPDDADYVYLGGVEIYRLKLSDGTYEYIGGDQGSANATNLHVDNHLLIFEPGSNTKMWAGNDGGMRFTDVTGAIAAGPTGGYTWTDRNAGYITYQYYRADINPTNGSAFLAGSAQDNAITLQPTDAVAKEIHGGDGTCIGVISGTDFNTYNVIVATQNGAVSRIENGTTNNIQPDGQAQGFKTYFLLDGDNTNYLYYPTNTKKLFRTRNASAIASTATNDVTTAWEEMTGIGTTLSDNISALSVSRNTNFSGAAYASTDVARKMYIGTADGKVYRLEDPAFGAVGNTPTLITPTGATGYVSDVTVNPYDDKEVMVTYSNYGTASVWHTTDATVAMPTWTNVEGPTGSAVELASARSALIVRANGSSLYVVGTSTGLYGTMTLSGATTTWERIGSANIALSPSVALRLRTSDNKAVLGTHGNGMFMLGFPTAVLPLDLTFFDAKKYNTGVQVSWTARNEVNFSHYNVQKSTNGKNFYTISKVKATQSGQYQIMDEKPNLGLNYYRLEMIDLDGTKRISKVVSVEFNQSKSSIKVYPTYTDGNITIESNGLQVDKVVVFNATGQVVLTANTTNRIDLSSMPSGVYIVQVQSGSEKVVEKVFKK